MSVPRIIISVGAAESADVLQFDSEEAVAILRGAEGGAACEDQWGEQVAQVEGTSATDFLRVSGFPSMLAFRLALLAESNLELYLETGEFLPVTSSAGEFIVWHHLAGASLNVLDKTSIDLDGTVRAPRFLSHRLPGDCTVFTTPEFKRSRLFIQAHSTELPSELGGRPENDEPASGLRCEGWRSLLQEAKWRGWTGLAFEVVWRNDL
jgi:hypothetical protein